MSKPKTWQQDAEFCAWLCRMKYGERNKTADRIEPYLTGGTVIYMWEAWCAGHEATAALEEEVRRLRAQLPGSPHAAGH